MRPFWSPLSALLIPDPAGYATPTLLKLLLRSGRGVEVVYAGDRMWPAVRHGQTVVIDERRAGEVPSPGAVVVGCPSRVPDLLRLVSLEGSSARLQGDADPGGPLEVPLEEVLAVARLRRRRTRERARAARRVLLDLREAVAGRPDSASDPAGTVRSKYDAQAPFYAGLDGPEMSERLLGWVRERVAPGGRILVAGSGTGRESFALAANGWAVTGVDFSAAMVVIASREAQRRGLPASFRLADLSSHEEPPASLAAVYFTYDVYSFLPVRADRVALLRRMERWLAPGGVVFLSARRFERLYDPLILTLQRLARIGAAGRCWGQSHTRWIAPDGRLHRSFVQVFTNRGIEQEVEEAGFLVEEWRGNHGILVRRRPPGDPDTIRRADRDGGS